MLRKKYRNFYRKSRIIFGWSVFLSTFAYMTPSIAETDNVLPDACKPISITGESALLKTKKPMLVMIHNLTKSDLWLTHPIMEPSASAGWNSRLQANHWSAFLLDPSSIKGNSFELQCIESKPGHEQQVTCAEAISICRLSVTMPAQKTPSSFWAGEDLALNPLMAHLARRGFEPMENNS